MMAADAETDVTVVTAALDVATTMAADVDAEFNDF